MWERAFREMLPRIRSIAPPGSRALEIGYGDGLLTAYLASDLNWRITALDVSPEAFRIAADNVNRFGLSDRVDLRLVAPHETRSHSGAYDVVFVKTVLYTAATLDDYAGWLRWIRSVLRPGGVLVNFETGLGGRLLRTYRRLRGREYVDACLYSPATDRLYDEQFEVVDRRFFGGWSQFLSPIAPAYALAWRIEEMLAPRTAGNCFIACVIARNPDGRHPC